MTDARRRAWRIVRIGGERRRRINPWREAATLYRDRAINLAQAMAQLQREQRELVAALNASDDRRPLADGELDNYVTDLRERCASLWMHSVDQARELEAAGRECDRLRVTLIAVSAERDRAQADLAALRILYEAAQELRYLMRDAATARGLHAQQEVRQRADYQWRTVRSLLEQLALNEQSPAAALAQGIAEEAR